MKISILAHEGSFWGHCGSFDKQVQDVWGKISTLNGFQIVPGNTVEELDGLFLMAADALTPPLSFYFHTPLPIAWIYLDPSRRRHSCTVNTLRINDVAGAALQRSDSPAR